MYIYIYIYRDIIVMVISCISYTMCYINMCSASALGYRCLPEVSGKKYRRSA